MSAHICDRGGGFVDAISFLAEKKTALPFHSSTLSVFVFVRRQCFRRQCFSFNSFLLVTCLFPEMQWSATNQGVYGILTASSGRRLFALPPPTTPTVHSNYCKSNMSGRINDRELITSACTNKTPALQASPCISQITVYLLLCSLATMIPTSARLELTRAHCWLKNRATLSDCSVSVRSTF